MKKITQKLSAYFSNNDTDLSLEAKEKLAGGRQQYALLQAKELQLFDRDWYEKHYGTFLSEMDAFQDYCHKSIFANVNPSENFDTEGYQKHHLDIFHAGESPLLHYIFHGMREGRVKLNLTRRWTPKDIIDADDVSDKGNPKIAIVLHVFYADFIDKFATSLQHFPYEADLFVSVAEGIDPQSVVQAFKVLKSINKIKVVSSPNRGRNFGPMLVEFSKELIEYDLMCHLHSKKSLYSGREQTQWFDYLNQFLLRDNHVVNGLLRLFEQHPELGVYYPTTYQMMPAWVNHWTCNKKYASDFVKNWGVDIDDNFINYPVGGMFWARPSALKQLLEGTFDYEDFPAEPLPNDGSWLHALERIIGLLAEKNGFKQFFYYPPMGAFTTDGSYKFAEYFKPPEQLHKELRNFDIVSFDIFDTLIRRKFSEPDYAKYSLGKFLVEAGLISDANVFVAHRNNAEKQLREAQDFIGDVNLVEIYQHLRALLHLDEEYAMELMELEHQFDLEMIQPKDEMVLVLQQLSDLGRQIWLVSDTYYTEQQIESLLKKSGICCDYKLFLSSTLRKRKDNGTMWKHILEEIKDKDSSFIHVGDNVRSDAQLCGDFGLNNMHILHPYDKWQQSGFKLPPMQENGELNEQLILKWGALISNLGRFPFNGG